MKSKEALEYLTSKTFTGGNSILETEAGICAGIIKQTLERLEDYKREVTITKNNNILLVERNIELSKQNEKLKKAIEIIKNYYKFKLFPPAMDNIPEISISTDWEHYISQQEYELLKEVLGE